MLRLVKLLLLAFFVVLVINCNKPTGPIIHDVTSTKTELSNFQVIIADYDSVVFKSNSNLILKKKDVVEIVLGSKENYQFEPIDTIETIYTETGKNYRLEFNITEKVDVKTYLKHYVLRFVMIDDSYIDIEHSVHFYKYYYKNAEVFLEHHSIAQIYGFLDDFDIEGNSLFFHPSGGAGLFKYNFETGISTYLFGYNGGDFISANENFVFIDNLGLSVDRYNLSTDSIDTSLQLHVFDSTAVLPGLENSQLDIRGLEIYKDSLYILFNQRNDEETAVLAVFDLNFNLIEYSFLEIGNGLAVYPCIFENILFMINPVSHLMLRYDLISKSFQESKPLPVSDRANAFDIQGIDVNKNTFYYGVWIQEAIFSIPISDLMD